MIHITQTKRFKELENMICPIPQKLKEEMAADPFYRECCLKSGECGGRIEWHHHIRYRGQRVNRKAFILPCCKNHHDREKEKKISEVLTWIALNRATEDDLKFLAKRNTIQELKYLNNKYGAFRGDGTVRPDHLRDRGVHTQS